MNDDADRFVEALMKLKEPYRACAALRLLDEFSYSEIADIMEMPLDDVIKICSEAEEQLREIL